MRRKEKRRGEGKKRRRKERRENTKRGQGGIEPPTSSTAHAESDVHARSLEIRNASFASEFGQWVPFLGSQLMISSPARFSPPSVQARERFVQATRRDARPWEETTLPCCGWKI